MPQSKSTFVSFLLAGIGVFLIYLYLQQYEDSFFKQYGDKKEIVVAAKDIKKLTTITNDMLEIQKVPAAYIQPGAANDIKDVLNAVSSVPLRKGEQLQINKIIYKGSETGISTQVSIAKRAVTIPVSDVTGVGKLIRPGDRIDVISSIDYGEGNNEDREVKSIVQDVLVLAVGQFVTNNIPRQFYKDPYTGEIEKKELDAAYQYQNVTVEVNPIEAQTLIFLLTSGEGHVYLTLRNSKDSGKINISTSNVDTVLGPNSIKAKRSGVKKRTRPRWEEIRDNNTDANF